MTSDGRDRELKRFVAGLEIDEAAFAEEVARLAVQRTAVLEALLRSLDSAEATARMRAAQRVARMPDVPREVVERLTRIAAADVDERVRVAGADALGAHGLTLTGDEQPAPGSHRGLLPLLRLVAFRTRLPDPSPVVQFRPEERGRGVATLLLVERVGALTSLTLSGLPAELVGQRLAIEVRGPDPDTEPLLRFESGEAVTSDGALALSIEADDRALAVVGGWDAAIIDLVPAGG